MTIRVENHDLREPVALTRITGRLRDGEIEITGWGCPDRPLELLPGQVLEVSVPSQVIIRSDLRGVCIWDHLGHCHKVPWRQVQAVRRARLAVPASAVVLRPSNTTQTP